MCVCVCVCVCVRVCVRVCVCVCAYARARETPDPLPVIVRCRELHSFVIDESVNWHLLNVSDLSICPSVSLQSLLAA